MSKQGLYTYGELTARVREIKEMTGVTCTLLGRSILGREIPVFTLGTGKKTVVLLGGLLGTEVAVSALLLDFIGDYVQQLQKGAKLYEVNMSYLFAERSVVVVPFLNPDGIAYATEGIDENNPLYERVVRMNGGKDLTAWQANARGVTLTRNFAAGFAEGKTEERAHGILGGAAVGFGGEYPESEPESAALGRLLRALHADMQGLIEWHAEGALACSCRDKLSAKTLAAGRILGRALGYREQTPEVTSPYGSPADWCIEGLSRPAYHVGFDAAFCPAGAARTSSTRYERVRRALFTFPFML